jgi:hypothetical protein
MGDPAPELAEATPPLPHTQHPTVWRHVAPAQALNPVGTARLGIGTYMVRPSDGRPMQPRQPATRRTGVRALGLAASRAGALIALATMTVAGCSGHGTGVITGEVRGFGGPAVMVNGHVHSAVNGTPMSSQHVSALRGGDSAASASTGPDGRYKLTVSEGTYMVSPSCSSPVKVSVRAGHTVTVDLRCHFP